MCFDKNLCFLQPLSPSHSLIMMATVVANVGGKTLIMTKWTLSLLLYCMCKVKSLFISSISYMLMLRVQIWILPPVQSLADQCSDCQGDQFNPNRTVHFPRDRSALPPNINEPYRLVGSICDESENSAGSRRNIPTLLYRYILLATHWLSPSLLWVCLMASIAMSMARSPQVALEWEWFLCYKLGQQHHISFQSGGN